MPAILIKTAGKLLVPLIYTEGLEAPRKRFSARLACVRPRSPERKKEVNIPLSELHWLKTTNGEI